MRTTLSERKVPATEGSIYTRKGDSGQTNLSGGRRVPKSSAQIELVGSLEELIDQLGVARSFTASSEEKLRSNVLRIQQTLVEILRSFQTEPREQKPMTEAEITFLETEIDDCGLGMSSYDPYFFPMHCRTAALYASARSTARGAERIYARADLSAGSKLSRLHRQYLNRLGDYLWTVMKQLDDRQASAQAQTQVQGTSGTRMQADYGTMKELGKMNPMSLSNIKAFMQALEDEAQRRGLKLVIAVCDKAGRPMAVHVMDDAFIASYDIAVNKAYTAVSLNMSTKELAKLCAPGGSLYGLQETNQGKIVIFGGGVTLRDPEGNILGGLGVSGSTADIDTMMGDVGEELFLRLQNR